MAHPSAPLRPWVDHYKWGTLSSPHTLALEAVTLPTVATELVIATQRCMEDHHPEGRLVPKPRAFLFGPMHAERGATIHLDGQGPIHLLSITFRPGVFPALFGEPAHQASNQVCDPQLLLSRARYEALLALCEQPMGAARLSSLEALLWAWMQPLDASKVDPRALRALAALQRDPSGADIARVARQNQVSTRHLERLFDQHFGVGPKHYARLWRFRQAAQALTSPHEERSLSELAAALGYSDQAHMTREFQRFAGVSPGRYAHKRGAKLYLPPALTERL